MARRGVGRALFVETRLAARAAGLSFIDAPISSGHTDALAFYHALGFVTWRVSDHGISKRYRAGLDASAAT